MHGLMRGRRKKFLRPTLLNQETNASLSAGKALGIRRFEKDEESLVLLN
jgi:hypothetical protein